MYKVQIHPSADIKAECIGEGTTIWQGVVILHGAKIGKNCNICAHCLLEGDVVLGDNVTVKSGVYIWNGTRIANNVFIGPNVTFSNDMYPRSKIYPKEFLSTIIEEGASIGAGAVLLPGITIGRNAMVGAGSVVTHSMPPYALAKGNPARITGYIENRVFEKSPALKIEEPPYKAVPAERIAHIGVGDVAVYHMKRAEDMRGALSAGEFLTDIPFVPKRYFLVFDVPSSKTRGEHAHRKCHQFLICVKGSCAVVVDNGKHRTEVLLDTPDKGIYIPPMSWGIQYKYSLDAVLLVFASDFYDPSDYIRNYNEFINILGLPA